MPEADPVEALFVAPPEEFVAARDALARALRAAGDRAGAARVRALRRPTRTAWALNVAARDQPDAARALADAVERLHDAQRELLEGGDAAGLRTAEVAVREAGDELLAALPVDDPPTVEKARATLRAAAVDADVLADLVAGRLTHEQVASGFGGFDDLTALAPPPTRRRTAPRAASGRARDAEGEARGRATADRREQAEAAEPRQRERAASEQDEAAEPEQRERAASEQEDAARQAAERAQREREETERREREAAEQARREREAAERRERIAVARAEEDEAEAVAAESGRAVEEAEAQLAARRAERDAAIVRLDAARATRAAAERR